MKKILTTIILAVASASAFAQGLVAFANTSTTLVRDDVTMLGITPAGTYRVGLYAGVAGSAEGDLRIVGLATNSALAGRFSGGNPFTLPAAGATLPDGTVSPGFPGGSQIAFQIRAWSLAAGTTYEAALANGDPLLHKAGKSVLGFAVPGTPPNGTPAVLFGVAAGQIGGFTVFPIPEPSTMALALLGGAMLLFRRRK